MRILKVLAVATVFAIVGFAASADSEEAPAMAPPERSISSDYILLGLLSVLMVWAAVEAQD